MEAGNGISSSEVSSSSVSTQHGSKFGHKKREKNNNIVRRIRFQTYEYDNLIDVPNNMQDIRIFDCVPRADLVLNDEEVRTILKKD